MRKEIGWNVGMHSHPRSLNKVPMNEAVNTGEKKTTISHTPTKTSTTLRVNQIKMCLYAHTVIIHYEHSPLSLLAPAHLQPSKDKHYS